MENGIVVYEAQQALCEQKRTNYQITCPLNGGSTLLKRNVDFGVIPKTKRPSLYKAGAENICMVYGLMQRYAIESKVERTEGEFPYFFYAIRCDLVKLGPDGREYVFCNGYGSANTAEKRNGFNGPHDAANNALKMAKKRALVDAALAVSGLSSMFSQDMENEEFMKGADDIYDSVDGNKPITAKQIQRIYAIAADAGYNAAQAKQKLAAAGYVSTKDIKQSDYDTVCALFQNEKKEET